MSSPVAVNLSSFDSTGPTGLSISAALRRHLPHSWAGAKDMLRLRPGSVVTRRSLHAHKRGLQL